MIRLTPLPVFSTRRYENRPRESFQQRLDRLDYAGRQEEIERVRQTGLVPSNQGSFPDIIEGLEELARWRRGLIAPNFADAIEEIREFRRRFEANEAEPDPVRRTKYLADIILAAERREARFAPGRRDNEFADPSILEDLVTPLEEAAEAEKKHRLDQAEQQKGPTRQDLFPVADPQVAKSGVQYFTGAQLDLLI